MSRSKIIILRIIIVIISGIIGSFLGFGIWKLDYDAGRTQPWVKCTDPPQEVSELIASGVPPLYIKTTDGNTYFIDWFNDDWVEGALPEEDFSESVRITKPCNFSRPEFSQNPFPINNIRDCVQSRHLGADGDVRIAFVLDNDGNIWWWEQYSGGYDAYLTLYIFPFAGLFFGLLFGLIVAFTMVREDNENELEDKSKNHPSTGDGPGTARVTARGNKQLSKAFNQLD